MLKNRDALLATENLSGECSRVEADAPQPCSREESPTPEAPPTLLGTLDLQALMRPQTPTTGINAIIGKWPGDETDEEIFRMLEEMS
jgi:hypothetical protein